MLLLAALPASVTLGRLVAHLRGDSLGADFVFGPRLGAEWVLRGLSAYVTPNNPLLRHGVGAFPDYPAPGVLIGVPFTWLSEHTASLAASLLALAAVLAALRALEVTDWRVYGVVVLWRPVMLGWEWGNIVMWCLFGAALCWRWRDRPMRVGVTLAAIISVKAFGLPLALWLLATRRYRALGATILWTFIFNLAAWAIVGFHQITVYIHMMGWVTAILERRGVGVVSLVFQITGSIPAAHLTLALALLALVAASVWRGLRRDDRSAYTLAIAASLFATPILWLFSYSLLLIPLALTRPRLSPVWLLPILLDIGADTSMPGPGVILLCLAVATAVIAAALRAEAHPAAAAERRTRFGAHATAPTPDRG